MMLTIAPIIECHFIILFTAKFTLLERDTNFVSLIVVRVWEAGESDLKIHLQSCSVIVLFCFQRHQSKAVVVETTSVNSSPTNDTMMTESALLPN